MPPLAKILPGPFSADTECAPYASHLLDEGHARHALAWANDGPTWTIRVPVTCPLCRTSIHLERDGRMERHYAGVFFWDCPFSGWELTARVIDMCASLRQ